MDYFGEGMNEEIYRFVFDNCPICNGFYWSEKRQKWIRNR